MLDEKNRIFDLLLSGQEANIELALTIAESLGMAKELKKMMQVFFDRRLGKKLGTKDFLSLQKVEGLHHLSQAKLKEISKLIGCVSNLKKIYLERNQLEALPEEMSRLSELSLVYLQNNTFVEFPKVLLRCPNISGIFISNNQIESLPPEIGNCKNLTILAVSNNRLTTLPRELLQLQQLKYLFLDNNPWNFSTIPAEFFDPEVAPAVIYQALQKQKQA